MNSVEERLREALRVRAEDFGAHPDAWRRLQARSRARRARQRLTQDWPARFVIPAAAAAAVVAIVVAASLTMSGRAGSAGAARPSRAARPSASAQALVPAPSPARSGPATQLLLVDPPVSAVIGIRVPWTGPKASKVLSYFWLGRNSPSFWPDQIVPGLQFCHDTVNATTGESGGFCWPLPELGPGQLARVTGREGVGTNQAILVGAAAEQVTSVAAVLPDGRSFGGVVDTGRGFPDKAWTVGYPLAKGVRLVFRDASGADLGSLGPAAPIGPPQAPRPHGGGVRVCSYPASHGEPAGQVDAYLVQGRVEFWSPLWDGAIAQVPAAGPPVLGGLTEPFVPAPGAGLAREEAIGYAHANVARVVLRLPSGQQVSTSTFASGWPGLRLWAVTMPLSRQAIPGDRPPAITATAYDAAGHVLGHVSLGSLL